MKSNKRFAGKHILVLEGYTKQSLPFIREFKKQGCEVTVLCSCKWDCAYWSCYADHKILGMCDLHKPVESERYIVELIKIRKYDMVFVPFEFSARILSQNKAELSQYAIIYANEPDVFDKANKKEEVMRVCMENCIPCPQTFFGIENVKDIDGRVLFPIIIKPHSMYGARGVHIFHNAEEMKAFVKENRINLKNYVIQVYIPDGSLLMSGNVMIDRQGMIKSSYVYVSEHIYPENGGTSTLNGIIESEDIKENCNKLVTLMRRRGEIGVDLMLDKRDNIGKIIEINPRPGYAVTIGLITGVNYAQQILEDAFGEKVTPMEVSNTKTAVRIMQTDILWFLSSKDRFHRSPKKLGYKCVKEQMFYWDDPLSWFAYLFDGIKDYRRKMAEKTLSDNRGGKYRFVVCGFEFSIGRNICCLPIFEEGRLAA